MANGVIPDVSNFITKSVDDLTNYYLKSQTYTKEEVVQLIGAINQFHYEFAASTSAVTSPAANVLYLIGPTDSGADKYEEYVYANNEWTKIGDTSIDLSGYVTTTALNTALADYTTTANLATVAISGSYNDLNNKPTIPAAQIQSDWNQSDNTKKDFIKNKPSIPSISGLESTSNKVSSWSSTTTDDHYPSEKLVKDSLDAKQATISDLSDIRSGASAGATAYQKPSGGIPKTDLESAVQTSLGKADTALQSFTETDPTVPA